jgi:hypothetical protein
VHPLRINFPTRSVEPSIELHLYARSSSNSRVELRTLLRFTPILVAAFIAVLGCSCSVLEDNGTHLAFALEKGAKELLSSGATEAWIRYDTLDGPNQSYYVEITPSLTNPESRSDVWSSYLVVSGKTSGGTSYHNRYVFVPARLYIAKDKGPTEVLLKKDGDRISVIALR